MTCAIVDDEAFAIQHMEMLVQKVPFLELKGSFSDPHEALIDLQQHPVDLIFLDIEMPNYSLNGIEFIQILGHQPKYVLTTAYSQYALQSYELDVVDFLHKPFSFDRFLKAVQKTKLLVDKTASSENDLLMYVKSEGKLQAVTFEEICYIESERNYISIFTDSDRIVSYLSLGELEAQLPAGLFSRIHKSYIIANHKVATIDKESVLVKRQNNLKELPLGEAYKKAYYQVIENKIIKKDNK